MIENKDMNALMMTVRDKLTRDSISEDDMVYSAIEDVVLDAGACRNLTNDDRKTLISKIFNRMRRYDVLQPLLDDDSVTEIMINGPRNIFIEVKGKLIQSDVEFESAERLESIVQQIVSDVDRKVNRSQPIADARLKDGSRVNVVLPPVALDGAAVTIRKFSKDKLTMDKLIEFGGLSQEIADFLSKAVETRHNILICGGTGSGKTTFLNALSDYIPSDERIVTVEDSAELKLSGIPNLIRLETRDSKGNEDLTVSMRDLIKSSLRMRPDRIIVGEVRGPEALDMLQAMNTGHEGSLTTGHSNSGTDMLHRLETMILSGASEIPLHSIRSQIASGLDLIVYLRRFKDGTRRVVTVEEIMSYSDKTVETQVLYAYDRRQGYIKCGEMKNNWKLDMYSET